MLVLISFGLVLVATVLLVLGLVADSGLGLIYVSIACSLAAGVILVVATRVNRPRPEAVATGPAPLLPPEPPAEDEVAVVEEVAVDDVADADFAPATAPVAAVAVASADDELFPIADYDDLSLGEILPLLPKLYADELDVVEARENAGKSRRQILSRLAELRDSMQGAPDDLTAEEWAAQQPPPVPAAAAPAPAKKAAAPAKKAAPAAAKKAAAPARKAAPAPAKKAAAPAKKAAPVAKKAAAPAKKAAKATKKR